ncbi:Uncharacterized protein APZ42_022118 [Daphnia magna]|uniref:Uncharacterized protein n=1 Tax=Daphnia magna TaxID=35525 RepID=A0A164W0Y5_9CRUS|nr:Uncharacterized protein APZ42_022118 [Daphnia magna]
MKCCVEPISAGTRGALVSAVDGRIGTLLTRRLLLWIYGCYWCGRVSSWNFSFFSSLFLPLYRVRSIGVAYWYWIIKFSCHSSFC